MQNDLCVYPKKTNSYAKYQLKKSMRKIRMDRRGSQSYVQRLYFTNIIINNYWSTFPTAPSSPEANLVLKEPDNWL